jgi:hypothetical protein
VSDFKYGLPSDELAAHADTTWSVNTGTENSTYPAANAGLKNTLKPAKLDSTSGSWVADLGSAKQVDLVAIINDNLDDALDVQVMAHTADTWGAPDFSAVSLTIPAADKDGRHTNPFVDLSAIAPRTFRYWRILINAANSANVAIGSFKLIGTLREFTQDFQPQPEVTDSEEHPVDEARTAGRAWLTYQIGVRQRFLAGQFRMDVPADITALRSWHRDAAGRGEAFVIIPDIDINDAWWVKFAQGSEALPRTRKYEQVSRFTVGFEEMTSGLVL